MSSTVLPRSGTPAPPSARLRRGAVLGLSAAAGILGLAYAADVALARDRVPRGTLVAGVDVGGNSADAAKRELTAALAARAAAPVDLVAAGTTLKVVPAKAGLSFDVDATVEKARRQSLAPWSRVRSLFGSKESGLVAKVDETALRAELRRLAKPVDRPTQEGAVRFDGVTPVAVMPQAGRIVDVEAAAVAVSRAYLRSDGPVTAPVTSSPVKSTPAGVTEALETIAKPAVSGPVVMTAPVGRVVLTPSDVAATLRIVSNSEGVIVPTVPPDALEDRLGNRLRPVESPASDAKFQVVDDVVTILPSHDGREVDMAALAAKLPDVLRRTSSREVALPIVRADPELSTQKAQSLGIREPIGSGTTMHPCCRPRVQNIHRMAEIVDGAVVLPGETFSLNGYVGPRDRKRGFVEAPMILNGDFVDSVGGGVSQFATTMFNAVFFSGMTDVQHKAHSYYISRYPAGREATVSYPQPDLRWRNDSPYGVLVKTSYTGTSITVTFYGTKVWDSIESVSGPRTRVKGSYTKYQYGAGCDSHKGGSGFDIVVTRLFKRGGKVEKSEKFFTRYLPDPTIVCRRSPPSKPAPSPGPS